MNFQKLPTLRTVLYRQPRQASNFSGIFDHLFLWILYDVHKISSILFLHHGIKKSKMTKKSNQKVLAIFLFLLKFLFSLAVSDPFLSFLFPFNLSLKNPRNLYEVTESRVLMLLYFSDTLLSADCKRRQGAGLRRDHGKLTFQNVSQSIVGCVLQPI